MYVSTARVAHMYYELGMTQQNIANEVNVSRIQVSRMLQQARTEGVVKISIDYGGYYPELEEGLAKRYEGVSFVVGDSVDGSDSAIKRSVGVTCAQYLAQHLKTGATVAVGWGTTLREVGEAFTTDARELTFVPVVGGQVGAGLDVHANSIAELCARNSGGTALRMFAPAVAESKKARDVLAASLSVKQTLKAAAGAQTIVFSVGSPFGDYTTINKVGYFSEEEFANLKASGAACDLISIAYFDSNGKRCGAELSDRAVSISLDQLSAIPNKICAAGGPDKHQAIAIALDLGLIDVLVTDDVTARFLLG